MVYNIDGHEILIDDEDFAIINARKWHRNSDASLDWLYFSSYDRINGKQVYHILHRYLLGCEMYVPMGSR